MCVKVQFLPSMLRLRQGRLDETGVRWENSDLEKILTCKFKKIFSYHLICWRYKIRSIIANHEDISTCSCSPQFLTLIVLETDKIPFMKIDWNSNSFHLNALSVSS